MTSDYKKYSLEKLQEWVHDAMNSDASPHEIYSAIREAVREDYYYHKDCISRATGLLELMSGHRPVAKDWDVWEQHYYPKEYQYTATGEKFSLQYTEEELNAMCDKAASDEEKEKCREYNVREAEYYNKGTETDTQHSEHYYDYTRNDLTRENPFEPKKWVLPVEQVHDDYFVSFPDDLLEAANLKEGDEVEWVDQGDGSYLLKKVENSSWVKGSEESKHKTYQEMVADGWSMTDDGFWIKE